MSGEVLSLYSSNRFLILISSLSSGRWLVFPLSIIRCIRISSSASKPIVAVISIFLLLRKNLML
jgi:hypothetical protein